MKTKQLRTSRNKSVVASTYVGTGVSKSRLHEGLGSRLQESAVSAGRQGAGSKGGDDAEEYSTRSHCDREILQKVIEGVGYTMREAGEMLRESREMVRRLVRSWMKNDTSSGPVPSFYVSRECHCCVLGRSRAGWLQGCPCYFGRGMSISRIICPVRVQSVAGSQS